MSSQLTLTAEQEFQAPSIGKIAIGINTSGQVEKRLSDGTRQVIEAGSEGANIIANKGVGLLTNIPGSAVDGDVYIATDTTPMRKYTYNGLGWNYSDLVKSNFVTDNLDPADVILYQYDGTDLLTISAKERTLAVEITSDGTGFAFTYGIATKVHPSGSRNFAATYNSTTQEVEDCEVENGETVYVDYIPTL